jgi:hypothetical protein
MKSLLLFIVLLSGAVFFNSCDKEDTKKPVINLIEPEDDEVLFTGTEIHFEAEFSDDTELASYKIDIHFNDGHIHKSSGLEEEVEFSFQKSWDFEPGKKNALIHHDEIVIPEFIEGKPVKSGYYHFIVFCTDKAGNESYISVDIEIERPVGK